MDCTISINNNRIDPLLISSISLIYPIDNGLPQVEIKYYDKTGAYFAQLPFGVGSPIIVKFWEDDEDTTISEHRFILSKCYADDTGNKTYFGGTLTILGTHPWGFFKDYTPHAYAPMKISELIKKVVSDDSRGYALEMSGESSDTDITCGYPRYKVNESDYDFIVKKLLPYATIGNCPSYFFAKEDGKMCLNSYQKMVSSDIKAVLSPAAMSSPNDSNSITNLITKFGLSSITNIFDCQAVIGGGSAVDYVRKIIPKFYFEELKSHRNIVGAKTPSVKVSGSSGTFSGNKVPIFNTTFQGMNPTSSTVVSNRESDDQFSLAINLTKELDKMFRISVGVKYNPDITIGSCVYLYFPSDIVYNGTKKATHWLTGKWVVYQTTHNYQNPNASTGVLSELVLVRPSFVMNEENVSLAQITEYLEV